MAGLLGGGGGLVGILVAGLVGGGAGLEGILVLGLVGVGLACTSISSYSSISSL